VEADPNLKCSVCTQQCYSIRGLQIHKDVYCGKEKEKPKPQEPPKQPVSNDEKFPCDNCERTCKTAENLILHKRLYCCKADNVTVTMTKAQ